MATPSRTLFASTGRYDVAYQTIGEGPVDIIMWGFGSIPMAAIDEEPSFARFDRRLASMARVIRFDRRGVGLSDRGSPSDPPTRAQWQDDAIAVLDSLGVERAIVFASGLASMNGLRFAAQHAERTSALIIVNGAPRFMRDVDYPYGVSQGFTERTFEVGVSTEAVEQGVDFLSRIGPSVADDVGFRSWFDRAGNLGATPTMARLMLHEIYNDDVRDLLAQVSAPTLIIHRRGVPFGPELGRYMAERIPDARLVEIDGADYLHFVGNSTAILDEIEEFVTGARGGAGDERALTTVLYTDIVNSTDVAARIGDVAWRDLLERHDRAVRTQLARFKGREVTNAGDGFLSSFDAPSRAIECARAIRAEIHQIGLSIRAGVHTGEVELRGSDMAGLGVHIGARVGALAGPGDMFASASVPLSVAGTSTRFEDLGEFDLKGVPGRWRVYRVLD